jgi:acylphosphatase
VPVKIVRHVVFRGRVQGVGFRAFVEEVATRAGLEGWVRNRRVGTVEAVFSGDAAAADIVIEACRKGRRCPASKASINARQRPMS